MERGRLRKALCSEVSRENGEPLGATASRVENWILVEYRGVWGHDALSGSGLSVAVKEHLRERARALRPAKTLFIRRPEGSGGDGLSVFWGSSPERGGRLFRAELGGYEDLLDLDFGAGGEPVDHPLLLVCLPEGLWFGRVGRDDAWLLLDEYLAGRIHLELYRGRSCYPFAVQAAERAVRAETGLTGIGDLELVTREPIRFRTGERVLEVEVEEETGELTYLTCGAPGLSHPRRYAARILPGSAG